MEKTSENTHALPPTLLYFILHFLSLHKGLYTLFFLSAMASGLWGVFNSLLIKMIINKLEQVPTQSLLSSIGWPVLLFLFNFEFHNISWRVGGYVNYKVQPHLKNNIITATFAYVHQHTQQFFQEHLAGRIGNQITNLADNVERIVHEVGRHLTRVLTLLIVAFITMYSVHPRFFYGLCIWIVIFAGVSLRFSRRIVALSEMYAEKETVLSGRVVDSVSNAFTVRVFARRLYEIKYIQKALAVLNKVFKSKESFLLRLHIFQGLSLTAMLGFMLWALLSLRLKGLVSVGDFALILGVSIEVGYMTWWGLEQVDELNKSVGKCQQSLKVLFAPHKVEDKPSSSALIVKKGQITFDSVDFNYASSSLLFSNLSITIAAHSKVGLVGYSGGGKSTFVNLILRLYDIQKGEILIDGQNIREVTQDSLRASIGLIPQESTLFHRSLLENLRYAQPNATMEEVIKAAKQAQAHEFIMKLPHGYQSLVGERGTKLSGGQRQRVAIARAILKDAPILILDEATSQLDSVTEIELQKALRNLMKHKTTLVIAHRLSTLGQMDRILVFEHGRIVQDGSHAQLVREEGLYKRLWEAQVEGILPEVPSPSSA